MTDARNTQIALEQWSDGNPHGLATQIALEHWASSTFGNPQGLMTQIALEHWANATLKRRRRIQNVN
jgi:hypothetical protein